MKRINNLEDLRAEKLKLANLIDTKEIKIRNSFVVAKRHTALKFSPLSILKNTGKGIFSLTSLISKPTLFKLGMSVGKGIVNKCKQRKTRAIGH